MIWFSSVFFCWLAYFSISYIAFLAISAPSYLGISIAPLRFADLTTLVLLISESKRESYFSISFQKLI